MKHFLVAIALFALLGAPWIAINYSETIHAINNFLFKIGDQMATVVMHNPKTIAGLQSKYSTANYAGQKKLRILVVPGHEPDYGGAELSDIKERNLNVDLAQYLVGFLGNNNRYEVFVTRNKNVWNPAFESYFKNNEEGIIDWQKSYKKEMMKMIEIGTVKPDSSPVVHNTASRAGAVKLFGINKWANENDIDIVIHIHFNDYPRYGGQGVYSGFAIYVPSSQFYNSTTTKAIAEDIFKRLAKYNPVSDLPGESTGIVNEPDLIAIGAYNTVDPASMLIEYGYIYESQFTNPETRDMALKDMAYQTYLGLQDFFDAGNTRSSAYDTLMLPYKWNINSASKAALSDIFALQTALLWDGLYPPSNLRKNDCPRTGRVGPCTRTSIESFQKKYGIYGENGLGPKTVEALNREYGLKVF